VRLDDLEWSKSSAVKVTVLDGTLKRSIRPASTATGSVTTAAGAAGVAAGAERRVPVLVRRAELTDDNGAVPMTRTSGSSSWARAGAGSASAPSASICNSRLPPTRSRPRSCAPRIALDRRQ
jgi:hypothetical protein